MKFYKFRIIIALFFTRIVAWLLRVEIPPILSVAALIEKDNKLLFIKLNYQNGYGIPGGIVKAGETVVKALGREVLEETGLRVIDSKFFASYPSVYRGVNTLSLAFLVNVKGKLRKSIEGEPCWLNPKEVMGKFAYKDTERTILDYLKS